MELGWIVLIPVVLAIVLAFTTKNVFVALLSGIISAGIIIDIQDSQLFSGLNSIYKVFQDEWAAKSILFCLMIGAFVYVIEASGGVHGMVILLTERKKMIKSKLGAELVAYIIGLLMFIDGTSSIVISGVASRPLFDRFNVSRAKLAYITDSTSSPIAWLVPFNGAGAFLMAMVSSQVSLGFIDADPMNLIIAAMPYQFYGIVSILIVGITILLKKDFNDIEAELGIETFKIKENDITGSYDSKNIKPNASNMLVPLIILVGSIFGILMITGNGNLLKGDGSSSIYIGVLITLISTGIYYLIKGVTSIDNYAKWVMNGMASYLEITVILTLAFALSSLVGQLGTGAYIAGVSDSVSKSLIPFIIFILGMFMSFATGTSGGTVSVLIPVAVPLAAALGVNMPLVLGAIISGAVFGDHCSPISDSTILASMIAEIDVMSHVKTQMPYALISAVIASIGFLTIGIIG
ncbi:Na+/H+ antiporter NhaC family protein [Tepidibacter aestuarii]|uniref:Na+/H+ antiporter NhaC family protein n=1 Tax=Tepidibacter aestuarii TaxID=2925782 RepID=UPI0020BE6137|nr:Na+/H+ antiporter NhaC family protein [Tepidibacter aestuarii]CAH2212179.1 tetracycline resistance efflux pump [Tepidibacter aestuarii]